MTQHGLNLSVPAGAVGIRGGKVLLTLSAGTLLKYGDRQVTGERAK